MQRETQNLAGTEAVMAAKEYWFKSNGEHLKCLVHRYLKQSRRSLSGQAQDHEKMG